MFTGIIESTGILNSLQSRGRGFHISVETNSSFQLQNRVKLGDSIACNGVCLTATAINNTTFEADVSAETVRCTAFRNYRRGHLLNLELACTPTTHLGGHIVQGHVDGIGTIVAMDSLDDAVDVRVKAPEDMLRYIAPKGSITVDGISLTVNDIQKDIFRLTLIPHTQKEVSFSSFKEGEEVNLEADVLARYLERLINCKSSNNGLTMQSLMENGFF